MPFTAVITGLKHPFWRAVTVEPGTFFHRSNWLMLLTSAVLSLVSTPTQNALSPAAVSTATQTSSSFRISVQRPESSASMRRLNALSASGRSSVTTPTWSRFS